MKTLKCASKRGLALFLALVMCVSMANLTALAADETAEAPDAPRQSHPRAGGRPIGIPRRPDRDGGENVTRFNGDGTYTFRLAKDGTAAITGIPTGTRYAVREDAPGAGWNRTGVAVRKTFTGGEANRGIVLGNTWSWKASAAGAGTAGPLPRRCGPSAPTGRPPSSPAR